MRKIAIFVTITAAFPMISYSDPHEHTVDQLLREITDPQGKESRRIQAYYDLQDDSSAAGRADAALAAHFADQALLWKNENQSEALIPALQAYALHPGEKNSLLARRLLAHSDRLAYRAPHSGGIIPLTFSSNGMVAALRDTFESRFITLRDTGTGKPVSRIPVGEAIITTMCFDGTGTRFALALEDKTLRQHDVKTGKQLGEPIVLDQAAFWVSYGAEDKYIITVSEKGIIEEREAESGRRLRRHDLAASLPDTKIDRPKLACSPDRSLLSVFPREKLIVWDLRKWEAVAESYTHPESVKHVVFHPRGGRLAVASEAFLQLLDTETCKPACAPIEDESFTRPSFDPHAELLTVGVSGNVMAIFEARSGGLKHYMLPHARQIDSIIHDDEGAWILSTSEKNAHLYSREAGKAVGLPFHQKFLDHAMIHPLIPLLITCETSGGGSMQGWKLPDPRQDDGTITYENGWSFRDYLSDPLRLALQHRDGNTRIVARDSGKPLSPVLPHPTRVWATAFAKGPLVATIDNDFNVRVWDGEKAELRSGPIACDDAIDLKISPEGDHVFVITTSGVTRLDSATGKPVEQDKVKFPFEPEQHAYCQQAMRLAIASSEKQGEVHLFDLESGKATPIQLKHQDNEVFLLSFSPSGAKLLVGTKGGISSQLEMIDLKTGDTHAFPEPLTRLGFHDACFTSDENLIVTSTDQVCRWWKPSEDGTLEIVSAAWNHAELPAAIFPDPSAKNDRVLCLGRYPGHRHTWNSCAPHQAEPGLPPLPEGDRNLLLQTHEKRLHLTLRDAKGKFGPDGIRYLPDE